MMTALFVGGNVLAHVIMIVWLKKTDPIDFNEETNV